MTKLTNEDYAIVFFLVFDAILTQYMFSFALYHVRFTDKLTANRKFIVNFVRNINPLTH